MRAGIQTQTAECIVIGEVTTDTLVVALNKVGEDTCPHTWSRGQVVLHPPAAWRKRHCVRRPAFGADLLPAEKRDRYIAKAGKMVAQTLANTKFAGSQIVAVSARPGERGRRWERPWALLEAGAALRSKSAALMQRRRCKQALAGRRGR